MQREPFEVWARRETERLRHEAGVLLQRADTLDAALQDYLRSTAETAADSTPQHQTATEDMSADAEEHGRRGPSRSPKYQAILDAMEDAGAVGMTSEEMAQAAEAKGHKIDRNALRPFIWGRRQAGQFVSAQGSRYVLEKFAGPGEREPNSSASDGLFGSG